ncbi:hypothetical protein L210DRAFT_3644282 [Boletus edulis BED1]|uniref:Protein-S-isoprenylcysteine O-methyltransferase n=1 Tax=Boletus edulis BED1 TaxID=1328754 RepID=A0AAD4BXM9_BOLED|nr:hypothetical protein L210DRAFT_3644282 [Boletus edulis BED1]
MLCIRGIVKTIGPQAESKGRRVRPESMPLLGRIVSPIHGLAAWMPPAVYIGALVLNKLRQPEWMTRFALPDEIVGVNLDPAWKSVLRAVACVAGFGLRSLADNVFQHLGEQWHSLGRREHPRVVQTGPYAWVRHPLYTVVLVQEVAWSVMFWSYIPLVALGITAAAFAVKMPIEEGIIQRDEGIKEEYREYKKSVPSRIIPYIW